MKGLAPHTKQLFEFVSKLDCLVLLSGYKVHLLSHPFINTKTYYSQCCQYGYNDKVSMV